MRQATQPAFFSGAICLWCAAAAVLALSSKASMANEYYELREYRLATPEAGEKLDNYLREALVPACERLGTGPVGVFKPAEENADPARWVLIPVDSLETVEKLPRGLEGDEAYQQAAETYMSLGPEESGLQRIRSELLVAFDCQPELRMPPQGQNNRLFELRTYESATPRLGDLKVEMFNAGEVPIFLDCGIEPVFLGQAIIGDLMPSLTYMTVYDDDEARVAAWKKFPQHPDWKTLSSNPRYKGTVSKIHKLLLAPTDYSQI